MLMNLIIGEPSKKFFRDKVILNEGEQSSYFYYIMQGNFELTRKVLKPHLEIKKVDTYIEDEKVRLKELTRGIQRITD